MSVLIMSVYANNNNEHTTLCLKNYDNQSTYVKVLSKDINGPFFETQCNIGCTNKIKENGLTQPL